MVHCKSYNYIFIHCISVFLGLIPNSFHNFIVINMQEPNIIKSETAFIKLIRKHLQNKQNAWIILGKPKSYLHCFCKFEFDNRNLKYFHIHVSFKPRNFRLSFVLENPTFAINDENIVIENNQFKIEIWQPIPGKASRKTLNTYAGILRIYIKDENNKAIGFLAIEFRAGKIWK